MSTRRDVPDPDRRMLARARRRITLQVAAAVTVPLGALGAAVYRRAAGRLDAAARRRLRRTLAVAEAASVPVALLAGRAIARRTLAPLADALARRRRFAADVGHELRAPLTRLHTGAQLAARRLRTGADATADVDRLVTGTRQLGEIVEDVLVSARLGRRPAALAPVDLGALAADLAVSESPRARERGVRIDVDRKGGRGVVRGSEPALRRVLSALLDNALRHTPPGGRVLVTVTGTAEAVELTVRDDGDGFDPRAAARLFGRFAVGSSGPSTGPAGFGLGLALAREVVAGHGGTIGAGGRPGGGAVFTVRLPAAPRGYVQTACDLPYPPGH
ncbi:HAMP domain-containing histidine kinase [Actinomadura sp. KC216]|uniref:sensor histidine kinase n=1 Tax=Actinomadura sp. KC216 TaxID=2530370 RepID=UPI001047D0A4|nr:HAMP domain-containing sensor histidine kinase [Actinomadura sp. KC216]TDB85740.1 HAMP domain-containing histidine kinase [Actinomadura sp. KC216]